MQVCWCGWIWNPGRVYSISIIKEKYITQTGSQVKYKGKIFNELNDKGQYYQFEDLTQEQYEIIDKLVAVNPNQVLYEKYIVNN